MSSEAPAPVPAMPLSPGARLYLWVLVFFSGMSVMALEMTASRVISPHFGSSISVWANVIGIILVGLSMGYWIGGRWAERSPRLPVLLGIVGAGAVSAAIIPFLVRPLAEGVIATLTGSTGATQVILGSFATLFLLFSVPIVLLGMTSPFAIRLLTLDQGRIGETAGGVSALSTLGSILGTFVPAFVLVPWLGSRATLLLFAGTLAVVVAVGAWGFKGLSAAVVLALVPWLTHQRIHTSPTILEETETAYQYVQVVEEGPERSMRFDEGRTIQSEERTDGRLTNGYWDLVEAMPELASNPHPRILILGMAAGSVARGIVENRAPGSVSVVGVEIDPTVIELGRRYFALGRLGASVEVHAEDARAFLERSTERFDMVLLDVYANQRYIPPHLVTQEFFHLVKQHLAPGGFLVANVNSPTPTSKLLQSFVRTIRSELSVVEAVAVPRRWNWELVASPAPLDWDSAVGRVPELLRPVLEYARTRRQALDDHLGMVLTDDRSPVELLTDSAVYESSVARR